MTATLNIRGETMIHPTINHEIRQAFDFARQRSSSPKNIASTKTSKPRCVLTCSDASFSGAAA